MGKFSEFLSRNTVYPTSNLPLVHTTPAYHLRSISNSGSLNPQLCDVFSPDRLNYYFVGRPAYKYDADPGETPFWELPCCFIFDYESVGNIKRVFPFDSGAFSKARYPSYISMMDISEFESSTVADAPGRIMGAFFGDSRSYFRMKSKSENEFSSEFDLQAFDAELKALHRLATERSSGRFDDRRFTIEVQSEDVLDLSSNNPLAVIAPETYFDDNAFLDTVQTGWGAQPISYMIHPLNINAYYSSIYSLVAEFYRTKGIL